MCVYMCMYSPDQSCSIVHMTFLSTIRYNHHTNNTLPSVCVYIYVCVYIPTIPYTDNHTNNTLPSITLYNIYIYIQLTPTAIAAGRRLADRLFDGKDKARADYDTVPTVVFSHPCIGA